MIPEDAIWILELIRNRDARTEAEKDAVNAAIEALKAQLTREGTTKDATSDLIDRQAAIDAAKDWYEGLICGSINGLIKRLNALPTIQPEPQWILCRNDLPDIGMTVLFCDVDGDEFVGHRASDYWWSVDEKVKSVIAWMPLPEAYKPNE